jgi:predicted molibdopterin-dependent oxidoreductase YjgC
MLLEVCKGSIVNTLPLKTASMNRGKLCIKGWNAHQFVNSPERLTRPLVRRNGRLEESSWDEALDRVVAGFSTIMKKDGGDALAVLSSARTTNEENYLAQKLCRAGFGTNNVDHCARL